MYDLLIKGGHVIDPPQNIDGKYDVAISGNKIVALAPDIPQAQAKETLDAVERIVTPGLIDIHCHVYDPIAWIGINPDIAGVKQGVTTVVDAGTSGQATFAGFPKYVVPASRTTIYCFLHVASPGFGAMPELRTWEDINSKAITKTVESNRNLIKGIKLRITGDFFAENGIEVIKRTKAIAKDLGLPIMVHIGDNSQKAPKALIRDLLPYLDSGDILSHIYTVIQDGLLDENGKVFPELKEAAARGVVMDVAHGRFNFNYGAARKMLDQGILPTTISSDASTFAMRIVSGLLETMSKLMCLGLSLQEVITMTTINPARLLRIEDNKGNLKAGADADVSILRVAQGYWQLTDCQKNSLEARTALFPDVTVKAGKVVHRSSKLNDYQELIAGG